MSRTPTEAISREAPNSTAPGSTARTLTLACATLTTGLIAGVFYAYAVSVNLGLAAQPDASYVATMQAINGRIQNPLFFLSFFGAVLFLLAALAVHCRRPRLGRFWLVAVACALYIGGGFLLTAFVNVPMNDQIAGVAAGASPGELARARAAYEGPWDFWNGVRTVLSILAFLALVGACLLREGQGTGPGGLRDDLGRVRADCPAPLRSKVLVRPESRERSRHPPRGVRDGSELSGTPRSTIRRKEVRG